MRNPAKLASICWVIVTILSSCTTVDRYAFHIVAASDERALPAGLRLGQTLDGVDDLSEEGIPVRSYELHVALEQAPGDATWQPSFEGAALQDDEGNEVPISAWFVDAGAKATDAVQRYRAVFELRRPYRFKSIMTATVRWKLVATGNRVFPMVSQFKN